MGSFPEPPLCATRPADGQGSPIGLEDGPVRPEPLHRCEDEAQGEVMSLSQGHWAAGWWAQVFGSRPLPIPPTRLRCLSGPKVAKSLSRPDPGSTLPPAFCLPRFLVSCTPSWFWGPVVTLEDCLAAFFVADELKGKWYVLAG